MVIEEILLLPAEKQVSELKKGKNAKLPDYEELKKQWDPKQHDVFDHAIRPDKTVKRVTGKDSQGKDTYTTSLEKVNRIAVPFQRIIVNRAVGFLLGNPVRVKRYMDEKNKNQQVLADMVDITLKDNKTKYFDRELARTVKRECEAAELWYQVEDETFWKKTVKNSLVKFKMRVQLLSPGNGDILYPYFDETDKLTAFSREFKVKEGDKSITHFDTWTETKIIRRAYREEWIIEEAKNLLGKIPVIYYAQEEPEWYSVQPMIDRFEKKASNFGDTNDYFGAPMVKTRGKVLSLPEKNSSGKTIQLDENGDADYMSWDQSPESEKLEFELLEKMIYAMSQTPNISFEQLKDIGGDLSGFAIKLMFTDAHLKAENDIELFGEMFQRRLNLLKHILGAVINTSLSAEVDNLELEPEFTPYLPKNVKEIIETLSTARGNKPLISKETALENNPFVGDVQGELDRIKSDNEEEIANAQRELTGTFNP